jgi:hypothetical protein
MGPPSCIRSVVDRNVVMRHMTVIIVTVLTAQFRQSLVVINKIQSNFNRIFLYIPLLADCSISGILRPLLCHPQEKLVYRLETAAGFMFVSHKLLRCNML